MTPHVLDDQEPRPGLRPMLSVSTDTSDPVSSVEGDGYGSAARAGQGTDVLLNQRVAHSCCDGHTINDGNPCTQTLRFLHEMEISFVSEIRHMCNLQDVRYDTVLHST